MADCFSGLAEVTEAGRNTCFSRSARRHGDPLTCSVLTWSQLLHHQRRCVAGEIRSGLSPLATVAGAAFFSRRADRAGALLPWEFALPALGFAVVASADSTVLLVIGSIVASFGTGRLLPTLPTRAMSLLAFEDRGRGAGLWTGSFFLGSFGCPLVLLAVKAGVGSRAAALGVLGIAAAAMAGALLLRVRPTPTPRTPA